MSELPKVGDRVRLTFEGTVRHSYDTHDPFIDLEVNEYESLGFGRIKLRHADIEILPPPVTKFGPGDTVRRKRFPELVYSLGREGYYAHKDGQWRPWATYPHDRDSFTSRGYERVEL